MYPIVTQNEIVSVTERYFTMPDGVNLYTRIAVPKKPGKYPVVFIRTPYEASHNGIAHNISEYNHNQFINNGYAIVYQHCRGRGDSGGVCIPYDERSDGLNSLDIIRELDIYNGEIFLFGGSYLSTVHLCYLDTNPEDIKGAVLNIQTDRMYFRNYRNDCCYNFCNLGWWLGMINREFPKQNLEGTVIRPYKDIAKRILGTEYPPYTNCLLNDQYNDFWESDPRTHAIDNLKIPVLFTEGWYDYYIEGMFSMWERLPYETKKHSAFIVGPWGHATSVTQEAEYPLTNGNIPDDYAVEWFNSIRSGKPYKYAKKGLVNYYSIGKNTWKSDAYPPTASKTMRLHFHGNNTLSSSPCETEKSIRYTYDPQKPLNCYKYLNIYKAAEIGSVNGVVSFLSEEFNQDISFYGKIRWHMNVSSNCDDTAFFIRVYFVENNIAYNLTETITSLSHIDHGYIPNQKITIDLFTPPIAFTVKKGGKIRVDISSDGGIYVPHANIKGHWAEVCNTKIANNTIFTNGSFIEIETE